MANELDRRIARTLFGEAHRVAERRDPRKRDAPPIRHRESPEQGREVVTWCFDEIQLVPGWERFVRRLLDREKVFS